MGAAAALRRAVGEIPALDQHAHLLAGPEAGYSILDGLSESRDPSQREEMRRHPYFGRALRHPAEATDEAAESRTASSACRVASRASLSASFASRSIVFASCSCAVASSR